MLLLSQKCSSYRVPLVEESATTWDQAQSCLFQQPGPLWSFGPRFLWDSWLVPSKVTFILSAHQLNPLRAQYLSSLTHFHVVLSSRRSVSVWIAELSCLLSWSFDSAVVHLKFHLHTGSSCNCCLKSYYGQKRSRLLHHQPGTLLTITKLEIQPVPRWGSIVPRSHGFGVSVGFR